MPDPDFDLRSDRDVAGPRVRPPRSSSIWVIVVALLVAAAAAAYVFLRGRPAVEEAATPGPAPAAEAPASAPLGGEPAPIELPPLAETDPLVRKLVGALSSHPRIAAWLATDGLIRNFVVVVENAAYGTNPSAHLQALRPAAAFRVAGQEGSLRVDPRSYDRYDAFAEAAISLNPRGTADLYATLKPRMEEAWRELGRQGTFDEALERAIVVVLRTPVVEGEIPLTQGPVGYRYSSPALERLSPAQKQLLRAGPRNTRAIQARLRDIAAALGIPDERLPD